MLNACTQENCTVGATGICLLNNDVETCPHRISVDRGVVDISQAEPEEQLLSEPPKNISLGRAVALSGESLANLMAARYCTVIGIVGPPDAGKTAALVSLYLLVARGRLKGFTFADSETLMSLDEISRGARRWNLGAPPEQMTAHTEMGDGRAAGFLHLKLRSEVQNNTIDLLLPDLPGEWSTSMVESSRHERLSFLNRADVIWLFADGSQLVSPPTRQATIHRTKLYLKRLKQFFPSLPEIILVLSRMDIGAVADDDLRAIEAEAENLGVRLRVQRVASFSETADVEAGTGLAELISSSEGLADKSADMWPEEPFSEASRAMLNVHRGGLAL